MMAMMMMMKDPAMKKSCKDKKGKDMKGGMQKCGSPKPSLSPTFAPSPTPIPVFTSVPSEVTSVAPSAGSTPSGGCSNTTLVSKQGTFYTLSDMTETKLPIVGCQARISALTFSDDQAREAFGKQIVSDAAQYGVYVGVTKMPYIELPESTVAEARWSLVPPSGTDNAGRRDAKSSATTPQLHLTLEAGPVVMVCFMATPSLIEYSC